MWVIGSGLDYYTVEVSNNNKYHKNNILFGVESQ